MEEGFGTERTNHRSKREEKIFRIFSSVAEKYDLMNDFMSFGMHRLWKQKFTAKVNLHNGVAILDSAAGSGDIGLNLVKRAKHLGINAHITITDVNAKMLQKAIDRSIDKNYFHDLVFAQEDAQHLSFANDTFDYYIIAFGIRNVCNIELALQEALRVLKPNGVFLCLEFAQCQHGAASKMYNSYKRHIIPRMGQCIAHDREAYQYLVDSIDQFYNQEEFVQFLKEVGFIDVVYENFTNGICAAYQGKKSAQAQV
ncbi:Ubiquinone/menaquinone biosynthesis C-methyltransferase UbiE [Rickettsiales endosymbiont of Paramecium tredecaurelia]|uniref:ubiquinone/menaquinone biosynthesis methyltransferase n=1 Tax=Candidatus Sarmatiella mevalonica TaxID=2770581 RepID=UPI001921A63A|nr:ubiquinone/menaquinone biosynthesis methyltransferase [Candidatus Sarmatiella mevalonica]MBL3284670.1 Ubiquinone/menaquinone biosynthesis C-methyltransferase UbiE [Candidatus Sarmatiella mevalonica]